MPSSASPLLSSSTTSGAVPRSSRHSSRSNRRRTSFRCGNRRLMSKVCDSASRSEADLALLHRQRELARAGRAVVALLQQRQHALAELGELRLRALAPEQVAAELALELLDRARQRGLADIALFGAAGEIEVLRDREKIPHLMHFHRSGACDPCRPDRVAAIGKSAARRSLSALTRSSLSAAIAEPQATAGSASRPSQPFTFELIAPRPARAGLGRIAGPYRHNSASIFQFGRRLPHFRGHRAHEPGRDAAPGQPARV